MNIEQKDNVKYCLEKCKPEQLYELVLDLPEDYTFKVERIYTYKPRPVFHSVLIKDITQLKCQDIEWFIKYSKESEWKTRLFIEKKVWNKYEALGKKEHLSRVKNAIKDLSKLRSYLTK